MDPFGKPVISETPDGNSLLRIPNGDSSSLDRDRLYLLTHYECDWLLADGNEKDATPLAYVVESGLSAGWPPTDEPPVSLSLLPQQPKQRRWHFDCRLLNPNKSPGIGGRFPLS